MAGSRRSLRLFSVLIGAEAAFAFLLLTGSALMIRSLIRLQQSDHGFRADHVLTMRVPIGTRTDPRQTNYDTKPRQMAFYGQLIERLGHVPGVRGGRDSQQSPARRQAMVRLAAGLVVRSAGSLALSRFLKSLLYETSPADPLAYTVSAAVLLAIGALASAAPAWKASAGDPLAALRTE